MKPTLTLLAILLACIAVALPLAAATGPKPVEIVFDTDIGNDVDDVLALGCSTPLSCAANAACSP